MCLLTTMFLYLSYFIPVTFMLSPCLSCLLLDFIHSKTPLWNAYCVSGCMKLSLSIREDRQLQVNNNPDMYYLVWSTSSEGPEGEQS